MARLHIIKTTAEGEQTSIESDFNEVSPVELKHFYKIVDDRLWEMNKRVIAANYLCKKLPAEAQMAIHNMIEVLHGMKPGPSIELIVQEATEEMLRERESITDLGKEDPDDAKQPSDA